MIYQIGKWALFAFAFANVADALYANRDKGRTILSVYQRFSWGMFAQCLGVLFLTITAGILLVVFVPGMNWGWSNLFLDKAVNVMIAPALPEPGASVWAKVLPVLFIVMFIPVMPIFAATEENMFRSGHTSWKAIAKQSVKFGLVHCIVGIPIGAGFALIIPGFFYAYHYRKAFLANEHHGILIADCFGVASSTAYHTMYNSIVLSGLAVGLFFA